jgi:hypothetical protein
MAASDALRAKYGNSIYIHGSFDYVTLGRVKYDALEFASPCAYIDGELFDVEAACRANASFKVSETLCVEQGNTTTNGYQKLQSETGNAGGQSKKKRGGGQQRGRGGQPRGGASQRGGGSQRGGRQKSKNEAPTLPSVSGLTSGNVYVHNGPGEQYLNRPRLDLVGAINDRFASTVT